MTLPQFWTYRSADRVLKMRRRQIELWEKGYDPDIFKSGEAVILKDLAAVKAYADRYYQGPQDDGSQVHFGSGRD